MACFLWLVAAAGALGLASAAPPEPRGGRQVFPSFQLSLGEFTFALGNRPNCESPRETSTNIRVELGDR